MEKDLRHIHELSAIEPFSTYKELYDLGARFSQKPDGGSYVIWPGTLDQLSGSRAVAAELSLSGIHKASEAQTLPTVQPVEDL